MNIVSICSSLNYIWKKILWSPSASFGVRISISTVLFLGKHGSGSPRPYRVIKCDISVLFMIWESYWDTEIPSAGSETLFSVCTQSGFAVEAPVFSIPPLRVLWWALCLRALTLPLCSRGKNAASGHFHQVLPLSLTLGWWKQFGGGKKDDAPLKNALHVSQNVRIL